MKTLLEKLAIERIKILSEEAQQVLLSNNASMGGYAERNSGFGQMHDKFREIDAWVGALIQDNK